MKWSDIFLVLGAFAFLGLVYYALSSGLLGWMLSKKMPEPLTSSSTAPRLAAALFIIAVSALVGVAGYKLLNSLNEGPSPDKKNTERIAEKPPERQLEVPKPEYDVRKQYIASVNVKGWTPRTFVYDHIHVLQGRGGLHYRLEGKGEWMHFKDDTFRIEPAPARIEVTSENGFTVELFGPEVSVEAGDRVTVDNIQLVSVSAVPLFVKFDNGDEFLHPAPRTPAEHLDKIIPPGTKRTSFRSETEPILLHLRLVR